MRNDWKPWDAVRSFGVLSDETMERLGIAKTPPIPSSEVYPPLACASPDVESFILVRKIRGGVSVVLVTEKSGRQSKK